MSLTDRVGPVQKKRELQDSVFTLLYFRLFPDTIGILETNTTNPYFFFQIHCIQMNTTTIVLLGIQCCCIIIQSYVVQSLQIHFLHAYTNTLVQHNLP